MLLHFTEPEVCPSWLRHLIIHYDTQAGVHKHTVNGTRTLHLKGFTCLSHLCL